MSEQVSGPATKVEDLLLPLAVIADGAANRDEVAAAFRSRYRELLDDGSISFAGTDLPH